MRYFTSLLYLLFSLILTVDLNAQDRLSGEPFSTRSQVIAKNGMAASNHPLAGQIALDILKKGGSAVDAAIAANAFLGFADPAMNGLGGDMFAIVWSAADEKLYGLNASGKSPELLTLEYFRTEGITGISASSPHAVTVPGVVDGWFELHEKFGRIGFDELLAPTIAYARQGVAVLPEIADLMDFLERDLLRFYGLPDNFSWNDLPAFSEIFRKEGRFPKTGELFQNPDLANTLEKIANGGKDAFYRGEIAETIVQKVNELGGFLSMEDLANHTSVWVEPISVNYRGVDVWQIPPSTQGVSVLQMLNILEGFEMGGYGFGSPEHIHYFTEAKKLAYTDLRTYVGDPDVSELPLDEMLS